MKKCNRISVKVKCIIKKDLDSKHVYNEKYLKSKVKFYNGKSNPFSRANKIPRECSQYMWLSVIIIDCNFTDGYNYNPEVVLEECKYKVKENQISPCITADIEISFDDDSSEEDYWLY